MNTDRPVHAEPIPDSEDTLRTGNPAGEVRRLYGDGRWYSDTGRRVTKNREKRNAQYRYEKRQQRNARRSR